MPILQLSPGNNLQFVHNPPRSGGVTFVFINALSGDLSMWCDGPGKTLMEAGHGILAYNLRGQSGSEFTLSEFDENQIVDDLCILLGQTKPQKPVYVGLSIGGLFGLKAHLRGHRAMAMVLINTLRKADMRLAWISDAVVRAAETGGAALFRDLFLPLLCNLDWQVENRDNFLKEPGYSPLPPDDGTLMLLKSALTSDWDVPYEEIDVPVLNISGLQDRVFYNADNVAELTARLAQVQSLNMANAGHLIPAERPEELTKALLDFAAGL